MPSAIPSDRRGVAHGVRIADAGPAPDGSCPLAGGMVLHVAGEFVDAGHLRAITREPSRLTRLPWPQALVHVRMHRMRIVLRTVLQASRRIGHLFREIETRVTVAGLPVPPSPRSTCIRN